MIRVKVPWQDIEEISIDPHEALKALEEQVPEVLEERENFLLSLLKEFVDDEECHYDHHGFCQTHLGGEYPCEFTRAREVLKNGIPSPWIPVSDQPPPKDGGVLLKFKSGIISTGKFRYGNLREPSQDTLAWRCDCCGAFADPVEWMPKPE